MLRLKELRRREKISQQYLADELGVSRSTISMWETGANQPDNNSLNELADYFSVSVDYLLGRTDDAINYEDDDLIAAIPDQLLGFFDGDMKLAHKAWKAQELDGLFESNYIEKNKPATQKSNGLTKKDLEYIEKIKRLNSEQQKLLDLFLMGLQGNQ